MDSWIWQPRLPADLGAGSTAPRSCSRQQRFAYGDTDDATLFVVPVHLRIDGVESKVLLEGDELRIPLPIADAVVVVNAGGHGFVRVAYDDALRARLAGDALAALTVVDRYNLVDDAWNAVVAGRLTPPDFVDFVEGFGAERDLAVWQAIGDRPARRRPVARGRAVRRVPGSRRRARRPGARRRSAGSRGPARTTSPASCAACSSAMLAVLGNDADAQARCRAILADAPSDPELVSAATSAVAAVGTDADYDALPGQRSARATTPQDQLRYLYALAEFPDAEQIQRTHRPGLVRRGQDAERAVPARTGASPTATTGAGVGRGAPALGRGQRAASRTTRSCA